MELRQKYKLTALLELAEMPRSTYYYHVKQLKKPDKYAAIKENITAIYHENQGRYGYRRITMELHNRGYQVNHKTVQRLMKTLHLKCMVRIKKYRSCKGEVGKIAPNILKRDFNTTEPNQKWTTDITEFARRTFYHYPESSGSNLQNLQVRFPCCDSTLPKGRVCFHLYPDIPEFRKALGTSGCTHPDCCNHMFHHNYGILHSHIV